MNASRGLFSKLVAVLVCAQFVVGDFLLKGTNAAMGTRSVLVYGRE